MSLPQQTLYRLPTIKAGLMKGETIDDISKQLKVSDKTIDRDIKYFLNSGEFETWIKQEWLRLHNQVIHEDIIEAYRNITKLMGRMVTQKREITETHIDINAQINELIKISRVETCSNSNTSTP